jgi:hypothetical protein
LRAHSPKKGDPKVPFSVARHGSPRRVASLLRKKLDPRDVGSVAFPMSQLQDPGVTPGPCGKPGTDLAEQPAEGFSILDPSGDQPAGVQVAPPRQRDELLSKGAQLFGP